MQDSQSSSGIKHFDQETVSRSQSAEIFINFVQFFHYLRYLLQGEVQNFFSIFFKQNAWIKETEIINKFFSTSVEVANTI